MRWCEENRVDYVFGLARNDRLRQRISKAMRRAKVEATRTGKAARVYTEFGYRTRQSWSRARRSKTSPPSLLPPEIKVPPGAASNRLA